MAKAQPGVLRVVGVPIGNLGDVSERVRQALGTATLVACEDTRRCGQLYKLLGLKAPKLVSFHKENERAKVAQLAEAVAGGQDVVLVSDSGMPGISDPGAVLVAAVRAKNCAVEVVPGPSAVALAVSGSGFEGPFVFLGFLDRKAAARRAQLQRVAGLGMTVVLYESPNRVAATLGEVQAVMGNRPAWLARELTKLHEEWLGPDVATIAAEVEARGGVKGECVIVVDGRDSEPGVRDLGQAVANDEIRARLAAGGSVKDVAAWVASVEGCAKGAAYARVQSVKEETV